MARTRSPAYPAIPLGEAIEYAQRIFNGDHRHNIPRDVAARHMGYKSLHGAAAAALSAVGKYGLLETTAGNVKVSDLAMDILVEPKDSEKRRAALRNAAVSPKLFAALQDQFGVDRLPSDEALRAHLLKENFNPTAVGDVIRSYRETMELVSQEAGGYNAAANDQSRHPSAEQAPVVYGGARVGDFVQWESQGAFRWKEPKRVTAVNTHKGCEWVSIDGEKGRVEMNQVIVRERAEQATAPTPRPEMGGQPHRVQRQEGLGMKEDVFALTEGDVVLQWPELLSRESFDDLKEWAEIVLRKIERRVAMNELLTTPVHGAGDTEYSNDEEGRAAEKRDQEREEQLRQNG